MEDGKLIEHTLSYNKWGKIFRGNISRLFNEDVASILNYYKSSEKCIEDFNFHSSYITLFEYCYALGVVISTTKTFNEWITEFPHNRFLDFIQKSRRSITIYYKNYKDCITDYRLVTMYSYENLIISKTRPYKEWVANYGSKFINVLSQFNTSIPIWVQPIY